MKALVNIGNFNVIIRFWIPGSNYFAADCVLIFTYLKSLTGNGYKFRISKGS